jgi:hypothetical protein
VCASKYKTLGPDSIRAQQTASSSRSSQRSARVLDWGCLSAVLSLNLMEAACGPHQALLAHSLNSPSLWGEPHACANASHIVNTRMVMLHRLFCNGESPGGVAIGIKVNATADHLWFCHRQSGACQNSALPQRQCTSSSIAPAVAKNRPPRQPTPPVSRRTSSTEREDRVLSTGRLHGLPSTPSRAC